MTGGSQQTEENPAKPASNFAVWLYGHARRVCVFIVGATVLLIGVIMIVAPGPAFIVIPLGLTILATEFIWARKWLDYAKRRLNELAEIAIKASTGTDSLPPK